MSSAASFEGEVQPAPQRAVPLSAPRERFGGVHLRLLALELFFRHLPPFVASRSRTQAMRLAGIKVGDATNIWGLPRLIGTGDITRRLSIGSYCGMNDGCLFDLEESVTIQDHVAVGQDVVFLTRGAQLGPGNQRAGATLRAPIVIEEGVWLGGRVVIMPGVRVGAGSVIGAGVVVTENVKENTLMAGGPAISIARWR